MRTVISSCVTFTVCSNSFGRDRVSVGIFSSGMDFFGASTAMPVDVFFLTVSVRGVVLTVALLGALPVCGFLTGGAAAGFFTGGCVRARSRLVVAGGLVLKNGST